MELSEALALLGLDEVPEDDQALRKAYLKALRGASPERNPEGFMRLRTALEIVQYRMEIDGWDEQDEVWGDAEVPHGAASPPVGQEQHAPDPVQELPPVPDCTLDPEHLLDPVGVAKARNSILRMVRQYDFAGLHQARDRAQEWIRSGKGASGVTLLRLLSDEDPHGGIVSDHIAACLPVAEALLADRKNKIATSDGKRVFMTALADPAGRLPESDRFKNRLWWRWAKYFPTRDRVFYIRHGRMVAANNREVFGVLPALVQPARNTKDWPWWWIALLLGGSTLASLIRDGLGN